MLVSDTPFYKLDFNSIKVRLKLHLADIKSLPVEFQFHKGTIKTRGGQGGRPSIPHFNSIKVRLKQTFVGH